MYDSTSRTGELMSMTVIIPIVHCETKCRTISIICSQTILPKDCAGIIVDFVGDILWSENISKISPSNCKPNKCDILIKEFLTL